MYEETEYLSSSEQLVAFLDGELTQEETTTLFYELANNPELQEQMRQHVQLKNSFKNTLVTPPPALKENILASAGLIEKTQLIGSNANRVAALLIGFFFNKFTVALTSLLLIAGFGYYFYSNNHTSPEIANEIPLVSSVSVDSDFDHSATSDSFSNNVSSDNNDPKNNRSGIEQIASVSKTKKYRQGNFTSNADDITLLNSKNSSEEFDQVSTNNENYEKMKEVNPSLSHNFNDFKFGPNSYSRPDFRRIKPINLLPGIIDNLSVFFRMYGANSYPDFNLANESRPIVNNILLGFRHNLNQNHAISLVGGVENFLMTFDKNENGIIYRYNQSWNGGWLGLGYHYTPGEINSISMVPELNIMAGATATGPIFRAGAGLNYYITDKFYLNGGLEYVLLTYNESQFSSNTKWFTTNKFGYTIGFGIGF
ncbi:hypothetical protein MASR1M45_07700 [Candidatus Kapaibacterium sp.]